MAFTNPFSVRKASRQTDNAIESTIDSFELLINFVPTDEGVRWFGSMTSEPIVINPPVRLSNAGTTIIRPTGAKLFQLPGGAYGLAVSFSPVANTYDMSMSEWADIVFYRIVEVTQNGTGVGHTRTIQFYPDPLAPPFQLEDPDPRESTYTKRFASVNFQLYDSILQTCIQTPVAYPDLTQYRVAAEELSRLKTAFFRRTFFAYGPRATLPQGSKVRPVFYGEFFDDSGGFDDVGRKGTWFSFFDPLPRYGLTSFVRYQVFHLARFEWQGQPVLLFDPGIGNATPDCVMGYYPWPAMTGVAPNQVPAQTPPSDYFPYVACGHILRRHIPEFHDQFNMAPTPLLNYQDVYGAPVSRQINANGVGACVVVNPRLLHFYGRSVFAYIFYSAPANQPRQPKRFVLDPFNRPVTILQRTTNITPTHFGIDVTGQPGVFPYDLSLFLGNYSLDSLIPLPDIRGGAAFVAGPVDGFYSIFAGLLSGIPTSTQNIAYSMGPNTPMLWGLGFSYHTDAAGTYNGFAPYTVSAAPLGEYVLIDNEYMLSVGGLDPFGYFDGGDIVGTIQPANMLPLGLYYIPQTFPAGQGAGLAIENRQNVRLMKSAALYTITGVPAQGNPARPNVTKGVYGLIANANTRVRDGGFAIENLPKLDSRKFRWSSPDAWNEWAPDTQEASARWLSGYLHAREHHRWRAMFKWNGRVYAVSDSAIYVFNRVGGQIGYTTQTVSVGDIFGSWDVSDAFIPTPYGVFVTTPHGLYVFGGTTFRPIMDGDRTIFSLEWFQHKRRYVETANQPLPRPSTVVTPTTLDLIADAFSNAAPVGLFVPELNSVMWFVYSNTRTYVLCYNYALKQPYILVSGENIFWTPIDADFKGFCEVDANPNGTSTIRVFKFTYSDQTYVMFNPNLAPSVACTGFYRDPKDRNTLLKGLIVHGYDINLFNGYVVVDGYYRDPRSNYRPPDQRQTATLFNLFGASHREHIPLRVTGRWLSVTFFVPETPTSSYLGPLVHSGISGLQLEVAPVGGRR
ncbi:hypothetical protein D6779_10595 [Candidatus Parcubacteria bacterium]|nr:MAG: hypothetical protein D6779_10595 [Candidatus Parcubacteria bacterium]